jgi:hypothetical protein
MNATSRADLSPRLTRPRTRVFTLALFTFVLALTAGAATRERAITAKSTARKPSPALASLPPPTASGPLRILLIDDDASDNNNAGRATRESLSDTIYGDLVSSAVGEKDDFWSIERVPSNANGPDIDRLRSFPLVIWYTGSSYGGNPDNSSVLSHQDEKTVRRYLEDGRGGSSDFTRLRRKGAGPGE